MKTKEPKVKTKLRMYDIAIEGSGTSAYQNATSMRNAVILAAAENIKMGGNGVVATVKNDKQQVYTEVKLNVTYKQQPHPNE